MKNKLTGDKTTLFIDQYGQKFWAKSLRDLKNQLPGKVSKMYRDKNNGDIVHVGYVIGCYWLTAFKPIEVLEND